MCVAFASFGEGIVQLCDSFNLVQHVYGPTHTHGHTVDLVLSLGLPLCNFNIKEGRVSDHMFVMLNVLLPLQLPGVQKEVYYSRSLTPSTALEFANAYLETRVRSVLDMPAHSNNTEVIEMFTVFQKLLTFFSKLLTQYHNIWLCRQNN